MINGWGKTDERCAATGLQKVLIGIARDSPATRGF
jgi:hypothetical protein